MDQLELTLDDGSSVWIDRAAIISFSATGTGTRLLYSGADDREEQVDVAEDFATVSDMMDPVEPQPEPGDFIE